MKRIFSSLNVAMAKHLGNVLEANGIECTLKGQFLSGAMGEIPLNEAWTEIWVNDDSRYEEARRLIETGVPAGDSWCCSCGERIEGQFTDCWSCGTRRADRRPEAGA